MIKYEKVQEKDCDEMANLWLLLTLENESIGVPNTDWWKTRFLNLMQSEDYTMVKAVQDGVAVGFADMLITREPSTGMVHGMGVHFYVLPEFRSTKVAGRIYLKLSKIAKKCKVEVFDMFTPQGSTLWTSKGFKIINEHSRRVA